MFTFNVHVHTAWNDVISLLHRMEKQAFGVKVACVCPGAYATNVLDGFVDTIKKCVKDMPEAVKKTYNVRDFNNEQSMRSFSVHLQVERL